MPGSVLSVISTIHPALRFSSSHHIHSWLPFPPKLGALVRFFKPFHAENSRKKGKTAASVFLSVCAVFRVVFLRVRGKVTTKQPQRAPDNEGKLAAERSVTGKTQQFDWGGKQTSPSAQLLADRRVRAAHLVWQRSSKSGGLKESDKLKEQLNYEA